MSQEQPQRPVTYGDVFPGTQTQGQGLATRPVTMEDASLMQSAESLAFGRTKKGGAASAMQSAASKNVDRGVLDRDAHSVYSEFGMGVSEVTVPGAVMDIAYVAGNPVQGSAHPAPTEPFVAAMDAVTIGEALEAAAVGAGDKPIDRHDARAIESAETRATGRSGPIKGGVGSVAQSAADLNTRSDPSNQTSLADVLMDATIVLPADKVATREDAQKVIQAELRYKGPQEGLTEGGVAAAIAAAADLNERSGILPPPLGMGLPDPAGAIPAVVKVDVVEEVGRYYPADDEAGGGGGRGRDTGGDEGRGPFGASATGGDEGGWSAGGEDQRSTFATATGGDQAAWPSSGGDEARGSFGASATGATAGEDQASWPGAEGGTTTGPTAGGDDARSPLLGRNL